MTLVNVSKRWFNWQGWFNARNTGVRTRGLGDEPPAASGR